MIGADLTERYGKVVADRVICDLMPSEMGQVVVDDIVEYLQIRAEIFHKDYEKALMDDQSPDGQLMFLRTSWKQAEDLAYLVMVVDNVASHTATRLNERS